jgi:competence protein ComEC
MLVPTGRRPDVLVGRGTELVAVRGQDGALSALAGRGATFELTRWLEHDGDSRAAAEVGKARAFRCDAEGCTAHVKGLILAVPATASALRDDCATSAILVLKTARLPCAQQATIIAARDVGQLGGMRSTSTAAAVVREAVAVRRCLRVSTPHPGFVVDAAAEEDWPSAAGARRDPAT